MDARRLTRQAIDGYLCVAKYPVDLIAARIGPVTSGRTDAQLIVDRIDAEVRDLVGRLLMDSELREDAARRRAASSPSAHIGRVRVQDEETTAGIQATARAGTTNDIDDFRRRTDRIGELDDEENSLAERAARELAEQEALQRRDAATKKPRGARS